MFDLSPYQISQSEAPVLPRYSGFGPPVNTTAPEPVLYRWAAHFKPLQLLRWHRALGLCMQKDDQWRLGVPASADRLSPGWRDFVKEYRQQGMTAERVVQFLELLERVGLLTELRPENELGMRTCAFTVNPFALQVIRVNYNDRPSQTVHKNWVLIERMMGQMPVELLLAGHLENVLRQLKLKLKFEMSTATIRKMMFEHPPDYSKGLGIMTYRKGEDRYLPCWPGFGYTRLVSVEDVQERPAKNLLEEPVATPSLLEARVQRMATPKLAARLSEIDEQLSKLRELLDQLQSKLNELDDERQIVTRELAQR